MQLGIEMPSRALPWAHLSLAALTSGAAGLSAESNLRRYLLAIAALAVVALPVVWVGPLWSETPEKPRFVLEFYRGFLLSLLLPSLAAVGTLLLQGRWGFLSSRGPRVGAALFAYLLGLALSFPVSFNYALLYPLIR